MIRSLSYMQQVRLTLIISVLAGFGAVLQLGLFGYQQLSGARDELRLLRRLVAAPAIEAAGARTPVPGLIRAANATDASAALQVAVNRTADAQGFRIENLQLLEPIKQGSQTLVSLRANGVIPEQNALALLASLAKAEPVIFVRTLELQKVPEMALLVEGERAKERLLAMRLELGALAVIDPAKAKK